jgi:Predicted site-specific integrase-resolvase
MSIQEIIQSGANISITVGTNDLLQFANHLIHSTKEELENTILAKKQEKYLTPDEAKVQLHVDRSTLWRWAKTGYLIPAEVGGKRLYKQSDIDIILNK